MNIIYVSAQCSEGFIRDIFEGNDYIPGQQAQKFNRLFAQGLAAVKNVRVLHISQVPAYKKSITGIFRSFRGESVNGIEYHYLPVLNIHRIQDILNCITSFFTSLVLFIKTKNAILITDVLAAPAAYGAACAAKLMRKRIVGIITDIPDILFEKGRDRAYHHFSNSVIRKCDGLLLLTLQMNEKINRENRPYIVVEGIADSSLEKEEPEINDTSRKIYLYTGTINRQYGIENLVKGFIRSGITDGELHIYGDGDYRDDLMEICRDHQNIRYFGSVLNEHIPGIQQKAFLLINPRSDEGEYTRYSFPSKNMEYLASGKPVLLKVLPGMPEEYGKYVINLEKADEMDISEKLTLIDRADPVELEELGKRARQFVLGEKNNIKQAERTVDWIRKNLT